MIDPEDWTKGRLPHEVINEAMARDPLSEVVKKAFSKYCRRGVLNDFDYINLGRVVNHPKHQAMIPQPIYLTQEDAKSGDRVIHTPRRRHL